MIRTALIVLAVAGAIGVACSSSKTNAAATTGPGGSSAQGGEGAGADMGVGAVGGQDSWQVPTGSGGCNSQLYAPPRESSRHEDECSVIEHYSNPPTSGEHYPKWARFQTYPDPIPRGYYLHSMEHGGVVLVYNCPDGCEEEVTAMQTFVDGLDPDPDCPANRIIITPDPDLDVQFAAASWGHMLKADCFDAELVTAFISEHYNDALEDVCGGGLDPLDPTEEIPADCGK